MQDSNQQLICRVCGDVAKNHNFGQITCESCKTFFRRNYGKKLKCMFQQESDQRCEVTQTSRRACSACRMQKCYDVGMHWVGTQPPPGSSRSTEIDLKNFPVYVNGEFNPPVDLIEQLGPMPAADWARAVHLRRDLLTCFQQQKFDPEILSDVSQLQSGEKLTDVSIVILLRVAEPHVTGFIEFMKTVKEFQEYSLEEQKCLIMLRIYLGLAVAYACFYDVLTKKIFIPSHNPEVRFEADKSFVSSLGITDPAVLKIKNHFEYLHQMVEITGDCKTLVAYIILMKIFYQPFTEVQSLLMGKALCQKNLVHFRQALVMFCYSLRRYFPNDYAERYRKFIDWFRWGVTEFEPSINCYIEKCMNLVKECNNAGHAFTSLLSLLDDRLENIKSQRK